MQHIPYLVVQYVDYNTCLPSSQLPATAFVDIMPHVGSRPSICGSYENLLTLFHAVRIYFLCVCFSKADNLLSVSDIVLLVHFKADKP